jgi:small nuclear ribonucleoprotein (snRNP)-like protein
MTKRQVVVRLKDKTLLKGKISNFSQFDNSFQLELLNGDSVTVNIDKIKAMFFVKSFEGNKKHQYEYKDTLLWAGDKMTLTFNDGEKMVGYAQNLDFISNKGFLITPADVNGNNKQVFASKSAIDSMFFC